MEIFASDIDRKTLDLAREHAHNMGVAQYIRFSRKDVREFVQPDRPASVITNPPYAAVSYTHLDVYKRQILYFFIPRLLFFAAGRHFCNIFKTDSRFA